jgi:hypothetical protein
MFQLVSILISPLNLRAPESNHHRTVVDDMHRQSWLHEDALVVCFRFIVQPARSSAATPLLRAYTCQPDTADTESNPVDGSIERK